MKNKAFPLIETIFVIVIVGLFAAIAAPTIQKIRGHNKSDTTYKITHYQGTSYDVYYVKREPRWREQGVLYVVQDNDTTIRLSGTIKIEEVQDHKR